MTNLVIIVYPIIKMTKDGNQIEKNSTSDMRSSGDFFHLSSIGLVGGGGEREEYDLLQSVT